MNEEHLSRVSDTIAPIVLEFCQDRMRTCQAQFRMEELRTYVSERTMIAPASPDRILRDLRQAGKLNYRVVNRRGSLYEVI